MPYIRQDLRDTCVIPNTPGELNYLITRLLLEYCEKHGQCYSTYNDCLGALTGAQLEFYRRVVAPYEDQKIKENGDVY